MEEPLYEEAPPRWTLPQTRTEFYAALGVQGSTNDTDDIQRNRRVTQAAKLFAQWQNYEESRSINGADTETNNKLHEEYISARQDYQTKYGLSMAFTDHGVLA